MFQLAYDKVLNKAAPLIATSLPPPLFVLLLHCVVARCYLHILTDEAAFYELGSRWQVVAMVRAAIPSRYAGKR